MENFALNKAKLAFGGRGIKSSEQDRRFLQHQREISAADLLSNLERAEEPICHLERALSDSQMGESRDLTGNPERSNAPLQAIIAFIAMLAASILAERTGETKEKTPDTAMPGVVLINNAETQMIKQTFKLDRNLLMQILTETVMKAMEELYGNDKVKIILDNEGGLLFQIGTDMALPFTIDDEQVYRMLENEEFKGAFMQQIGTILNKCLAGGTSGEDVDCKKSNQDYQNAITTLEQKREKEGYNLKDLRITVIVDVTPTGDFCQIALITPSGVYTTQADIKGIVDEGDKKELKKRIQGIMGEEKFKEIIKKEIVDSIKRYFAEKQQLESAQAQSGENSFVAQSSANAAGNTKKAGKKDEPAPKPETQLDNRRGFRLSVEGMTLPHATNPDEEGVKLTFAGGIGFDADIYRWGNISLTGAFNLLFSEGGNDEPVNVNVSPTIGANFDIGKWAVRAGIGGNINTPDIAGGVYGLAGGRLKVFETENGVIALYTGVRGFVCYSPSLEELQAGVMFELTTELKSPKENIK